MPQRKGTPANTRNVERNDMLYKEEDPDFLYHYLGNNGTYRIVHSWPIRDGKRWFLQNSLTKEEFNDAGYIHTGFSFDWATHDPPKEPSYVASEYDVNDGWLSPRGRLYPCGYVQHQGLATRIMFHVYNCRNEFVDGGLKLEKKGWIKLSDNIWYFPYRRDRDFEPNKYQVEYILDWCVHNNEKPPYELRPSEIHNNLTNPPLIH